MNGIELSEKRLTATVAPAKKAEPLQENWFALQQCGPGKQQKMPLPLAATTSEHCAKKPVPEPAVALADRK
ncbi:hypothetical protein PEC18_30835 [Paucibacter sp. O1-1]|nr:hypothetical protein [Paucibacter sp. O1-1]MDA3830104.1 hypothetical protein [Paucibacter sp. O1-1]